MPRDDIAAVPRRALPPGNIVLAAAGNLDARRGRRRWSTRAFPARRRRRARRAARSRRRAAAASRSCTAPTEQAHVVLGMRALAAHDPDRYALSRA